MATGGREAAHAGANIGTTCARRSTGRLYCWGYNFFGQLGDGTTTERRVPTPEAGGATDWRSVSVGMSSTCATTTDSRAYCWGYNAFGQLGTNNFNNHRRPEEIWAGGSSGTSGNGSSGTSSGSPGERTAGRAHRRATAPARRTRWIS